MTKRSNDRKPTHPGAILREDVLPALHVTKVQIAQFLGISRETLYKILREQQPITPEMAVRIGKLCGNGAQLWLNLQMKHDLWLAEKAINTDKIPTLTAA